MNKKFKYIEIYAKDKNDKNSKISFANVTIEKALEEFYRYWSIDDLDFMFIRN